MGVALVVQVRSWASAVLANDPGRVPARLQRTEHRTDCLSDIALIDSGNLTECGGVLLRGVNMGQVLAHRPVGGTDPMSVESDKYPIQVVDTCEMNHERATLPKMRRPMAWLEESHGGAVSACQQTKWTSSVVISGSGSGAGCGCRPCSSITCSTATACSAGVGDDRSAVRTSRVIRSV